MPTARSMNVGVHATTRPYLDLLFPIPDGSDFGDGTAELVHSHQDPTDEHFGVVKFDYNLGRKDTLMVRWSRDDSKTVLSQSHPLTSSSTPPRTPATSRRRISTCSAANLLNVLRFAANRTGAHGRSAADDRDPDVAVLLDRSALRRDRHRERLDRRIDRDDAGRLQAGRLPAVGHADLEQELARHEGGLRPARTTTSTASRSRATAARSASVTCRSS